MIYLKCFVSYIHSHNSYFILIIILIRGRLYELPCLWTAYHISTALNDWGAYMFFERVHAQMQSLFSTKMRWESYLRWQRAQIKLLAEAECTLQSTSWISIHRSWKEWFMMWCILTIMCFAPTGNIYFSPGLSHEVFLEYPRDILFRHL